MSLKVLYIGEIVGKPGVFCLKSGLQKLKEAKGIDFTIVNGDGTTQGFGLGKNHAMYLRKLGADVVTGGDMIFFKKDMVPLFDTAYHVLRPANFPPSAPGRGWKIYSAGGKKIAVISLLGMAGFNRVHPSNPFTFLPDLAKRMKVETPFVIVDFHAVTTAEKVAMQLHADGKVSALIGSGMRCQTADAEVLPGGTAIIGDVGRTGSLLSVGGFDPLPEIQQYVTAIPQRSKETWEGLEIQACVIEFDDEGQALSIEALRIPVTDKPANPNGEAEESTETSE